MDVMKTRVLFVPVIALLVLVFGGCSKNNEIAVDDLSLKSAAITSDAHNMVPNEVLVRFKAGTADAVKLRVLGLVNGKVKEKILTKMMEREGDKEGINLVNIPGPALEAISRVKGMPEVEYAEPNYIYTHDGTSNDTYFTNGSLWGMYGPSTSPANIYGSQAAVAWAAGHTGSATVYVGIIDEGYYYSHEDLAANAGTNPGETAGNGIDDDKNGYIDDVYGWDFDGNNNTVFDGTNDDHGTHVAGTIGGVGGNGKGVAGVCWNVKLLDAKFLGNRGGTTANAIKAVDYFTNLKTRTVNPVNIVATNNSWGGGGKSTDLQAAIERANAANILFIAAAGNGDSQGNGINIDVSPQYPASYPNDNIIAVAAIDKTGAIASWSNYGKNSVDLGAPGVAITSSLPGSSKGKVVSTYGSYSGTSMATPHVTGAAALYASTHPGATAAQIKAAILSSVLPTSSISAKCISGGRLNVSGF
jgi:subtilisin family serine protease